MTVNSLILRIDSTQAKQGAAQFQHALNRVKMAAGQAVTATEAQTAAMRKAGIAGSRASAGIMSAVKPMLALVGISKTIQTLSDFEEKMTLAGAVAGATGETLQQMTDLARELGATTRFTGAQAAEGMLMLSRAGFTAAESMAAIADSLDLATAGGLELGEATGFMSNSIRQFGLEAYEASRVADAFTVISNNSNTDIRQLAEALKYAGTVAGSLGFSVEEASGAIGILGDRGVQASMAGTQLRGTLLALASPTDGARAAIEKLRVNVEDLNPASNDLVSIAKTLGQGIDNLKNPLEAAGLFADIFGRRNAAAALALAQANDKLEENINLANESNTAHETLASTMEQTLIGQYKAMVSAIEETMLVAGDSGLNGILKSTMQVVAETARMLGGVKDAFTQASTSAKVFTTGLFALMSVMVARKIIGFGLAIAGIKAQMASASLATVGFTGALNALKVAMIAHPVFFVATALTTIAGVMFFAGKESDEYALRTEELAKRQEELNDAMEKVKQTTLEIEEARNLGDRKAEINAIRERKEQFVSMIAEMKKARGQLGEGLVDANLIVGGLTNEQQLSITPTFSFQGQEQIVKGLVDYNKALELAEGQIDDLNKRLSEIDPSFKLFAENTDLGTVNLNKFLEEEEAVIRNLKQMGETAQETALIQGTLAEVMKQEAEITRKLTADEIAQIRKVVEERENAEVAIQNQILAERQLAREKEKAKQESERYLESLQKELRTIQNANNENKASARLNEHFANLRERNINLLSAEGIKTTFLAAQIGLLTAQKKKEKTEIDEVARAGKRAQLQITENVATLQAELEIRKLYGKERERAVALIEIENMASLALSQTLNDEERAAVEALIASYKKLTEEVTSVNEMRAVAEGMGDAFADAFKTIIDGSMSAKDAFRAMYEEILSMVYDTVIKDQISGWFSGLMDTGGGGGGGGGLDLPPLGGSARGNVFDDNGKRYAYGGIVNKATKFFAKGGMGIMGEAGAEAIMPLARDNKGRLGVRSQNQGGGNTTIVNMNVTTKDADSFRRSKIQIQDDLQRVTTRVGGTQ